MTLTKNDLTNTIWKHLGLPKSQSAALVECLLEIIKRTLESGEDVLISGFGKFLVRDKSKRRGRNPVTGGDMMLDERRVVVFKCSGVLRERVGRKEKHSGI